MEENLKEKNSIIEMQNVSVVYKAGLFSKIRALDGVSFSIKEGDIFGLLGPNGAGKSTAMYCFLGLIQPNSGSVNVLGEKPELGNKIYNDIAYLPEEPHYHPYLRVEEAVWYYANLYRRKITFQEVINALNAVGLEEFRRLKISKCSKGMKQKVGIAACMLFRPRLLFLDEPTRGLDPSMVRQFRDYILKMNNLGTTVILNSHILSEVEMVCTRVAILDRGKVLADDKLSKLISVSEDEYEVVIEKTENIPEFITNTKVVSEKIIGIVKKTDLANFVNYCISNNIRIESCRISTETLEDVFLRIVEGKKNAETAKS